ncbi:MAG: hypothetical protein ACPHX8_08895 [Candidatus Poseidoniaceae archaeon]
MQLLLPLTRNVLTLLVGNLQLADSGNQLVHLHLEYANALLLVIVGLLEVEDLLLVLGVLRLHNVDAAEVLLVHLIDLGLGVLRHF